MWEAEKVADELEMFKNDMPFKTLEPTYDLSKQDTTASADCGLKDTTEKEILFDDSLIFHDSFAVPSNRMGRSCQLDAKAGSSVRSSYSPMSFTDPISKNKDLPCPTAKLRSMREPSCPPPSCPPPSIPDYPRCRSVDNSKDVVPKDSVRRAREFFEARELSAKSAALRTPVKRTRTFVQTHRSLPPPVRNERRKETAVEEKREFTNVKSFPHYPCDAMYSKKTDNYWDALSPELMSHSFDTKGMAEVDRYLEEAGKEARRFQEHYAFYQSHHPSRVCCRIIDCLLTHYRKGLEIMSLLKIVGGPEAPTKVADIHSLIKCLSVILLGLRSGFENRFFDPGHSGASIKQTFSSLLPAIEHFAGDAKGDKPPLFMLSQNAHRLCRRNEWSADVESPEQWLSF